MLKEKKTKAEADRENEMVSTGYQAYTTSVGMVHLLMVYENHKLDRIFSNIGWLGYNDQKINGLCKEYLGKGFTSFKVKVGQSLEDDKKRCKLVREAIGPKNNLVLQYFFTRPLMLQSNIYI